MKANKAKAGTARTLGLCFCFVGAATWTHHAPKVTYHGRAPIGHHSGSSSRRTHLRRHVVEAGVGGTGAGQLTVHARVGHHPEWGGVWAGHCQGRPQASRCKEAQATRDSTGSSGPAWLAIQGELLVLFFREKEKGEGKKGDCGMVNQLQFVHRIPSSPELTSSGKNRPQGKHCLHISS